MKHLRILGLAVAAVLALSAVAASGASAATCGETGTLPCFTVGGPFTATSGHGLLETVKEHKVECEKDTSSGEIEPLKAVKKVVVKFTECKEPATKVSCKTSGANAGEIVTNPLKGEIGYINKANKEVGLDLQPETGELFVTFECGSAPLSSTLKVRGSVIGKLTPVNKKGKEYELVYKLTVPGKQEITKFEGGAEDVLETESTGIVSFKFEKSAEETTAKITTTNEGEIKA